MDTINAPASTPESAGSGGVKRVVGIAVVILFAIAFGLFVYRVMTAEIPGPGGSFPTTPVRQDATERKNANPAVPVTPAVKSADGVVDAISAESDAEMVSVGQELSSEESLAGAEAEVLNDLNQSYDETQY